MCKFMAHMVIWLVSFYRHILISELISGAVLLKIGGNSFYPFTAKYASKSANDFPIGIKLNSADFQKGGFSEEESLAVIMHLEKEGIDHVEISGGTYEEPTMSGKDIRESTKQREAYFLQFAEKIRNEVKVPLAVTGGFRSAAAMNAALNEGSLDMVGLARPLAVDTEYPNKLLAGQDHRY